MSDGFLGAADARAWWSTVRAASQDLARMERAVGRMRAREGVRGAPLSGTRGPSGPRDATRATDDRMDYEAACAPAMESARSLLALADELAWGPGGVGGVACLMGASAASVLHLRHVEARPWSQVALDMGLSESRCRQMEGAAMDLMDALGPGRVLDGNGCATEPLPLGI